MEHPENLTSVVQIVSRSLFLHLSRLHVKIGYIIPGARSLDEKATVRNIYICNDFTQ